MFFHLTLLLSGAPFQIFLGGGWGGREGLVSEESLIRGGGGEKAWQTKRV